MVEKTLGINVLGVASIVMPQVKQPPRERIFRLSGTFAVVTSQLFVSLFTFKEALIYLWFTQSHLMAQ